LSAGIFQQQAVQIEVVPGPDDDWIDEAGQARFLGSDWKLSGKSDRTGFRLDGPQWTFTTKAYDKLPENGSEPSNIIDHGYPLGAINLAGQTPIILVSDGPSMGGFINPYTVPSAAFWKLGQSRPGDVYRFKAVSVDESAGVAAHARTRCAARAAWHDAFHEHHDVEVKDYGRTDRNPSAGQYLESPGKAGRHGEGRRHAVIMEVMKTEVRTTPASMAPFPRCASPKARKAWKPASWLL